MITITKEQFIGFEGTEHRTYIEAYGLSTDTKPTGHLNGSLFVEMDTKKKFRYDEDGSQWREQ